MFKPTLRNRIEKATQNALSPIMTPIRKKRLIKDDFSIISNNCWGGITYEWYGLEKRSPTVGMWFFADDYLKFVSNLNYYLSYDIEVFPMNESRRYQEIKSLQATECPIGKIAEDIEVVFLHYKDPQIAADKWNRRRKRVNFDNLVVKFSNMNGCTPEMLQLFDNLSIGNYSAKKIMFINKPDQNLKCGAYYPGFENEEQIGNDTYFFNKYIDLTRFLNEGIIVSRNC